MTVHPNVHTEIDRELIAVKSDLEVVKVKIDVMADDIKEIKESQKEVTRFMLRHQGGTAWFFGALTVAATLGGLVTYLLNMFKH